MNAYIIKHATTEDGNYWNWHDMGVVVGNTLFDAKDKAETFITNMKLVDEDNNESQLHKYSYESIKVLP